MRYLLIVTWLAAWALTILLFSLAVMVLIVEVTWGKSKMGFALIGASLLPAWLLWFLGNKLFPDMWRRRPS